MALAFLQFKGMSQGTYQFHADIGTARFFRYILGERRQRLKVGRDEHIEVLSGVRKASGLMQINEAMSKINQGGFPLNVPQRDISKDLKYIQLYSYKDRDTKVPSISDILRLYPLHQANTAFSGAQISLTQSIEQDNSIEMQVSEVRNKAFTYREPSFSKVMFWNAIVSALPNLVQTAAPIIGGLLGGGGDSTTNNTAGNSSQTDDVMNKVVEVLQAIANTNANNSTPAANNTPVSGNRDTSANTSQPGNATTSTPADAGSTSQSVNKLTSGLSLEPEVLIGLRPILERILSPEAILAIGDDPQKLFMAVKNAVQKTEGTVGIEEIEQQVKKNSTAKHASANGTYSKAKVAPALLAALPALMPVIEKVLNPETIEAIGNQPMKMFKAIGDAVLKMDEQEIKHLEAINPGVDSADDIAKLLQGMSIATAYDEERIKFKVIKNLVLNFSQTKTVNFKGKDRVLLHKGSRIVLPFHIRTAAGTAPQKVLEKSIIQILIKDPSNMKMVFRKNIKLLDVSLSQEINEAYLLPEEVKQIPCNRELKLELSHVWKSNRNENIGVFKSHYIHFIDDVLFDRIGQILGEPIPLNDIHVHRKYWHKIWEGGFTKSSRWHVEFDLKYFYLLQLKEDGLSRLETRKMILADNVEEAGEHPKRRKVHAKLKSGFEFGLNAMNELLLLLNQQPLEESELDVLKNSSIDKEYQQVARYRLELKGREGDTATLWSYPEIALHKLHFSKIGTTDEYGQVTRLQAIEKVIPKPFHIHLLGTKSER